MTEPIRKELRHVEFPGAAWTAFDRYSRYGAIVRALRATLGGGTLRVLDVGDGAGYLSAFDPDVDAVSVDLAPTAEPLPGTVRLAADGTRLPFPDACFDAVVSSDALEHVPPARRPDFVAELARVSRELVLLAAPFDTPGVAGAEELARRFVLLVTGRPQEQLDEHRDHGLPGVEDTQAAFEGLGLRVAVAGAGNLHDWLAMMLLKHQLVARPALAPLDTGYDIAYNWLFSGRDHVPPFYRHLVAAGRTATPSFGDPTPLDAGAADGIGGLLAAFTAANVAEAVRQDTNDRVMATEALVADVSPRLAAIEEALARLDARSQTHQSSLEHLLRLVRHPLASAADKVRRKPDR
ncbi:MAG TPA: class I SAM-dependent methyltransferase [Acidimicrobiales bacterium]